MKYFYLRFLFAAVAAFMIAGTPNQKMNAERPVFADAGEVLSPSERPRQDATLGGAPLDSLYTEREEGKKYVALTFDDGPDKFVTPKILDILKDNDAKGTFFVLGCKVSEASDIVAKIAADGNEIGSHTYDHLLLTKLSEKEITEQIEKTNEVIYEITGKPVRLLRPPYGSRNSKIIDCTLKNEMSIIIWDIDPQDWKKTNAKAIAEHVIKRAKDGSIILLHDVYKDSAIAVEKIIEELKSRDYEFLTVSDLIHMNYGLEYGMIYRNAMGVTAK